MSRFGRAMEKADREGLLTWTRGGEGDPIARGPATEDPPLPSRPAFADPVPTPAERDMWDAPDVPDAPFSPLFVAATEPNSPAAEQYRLLRTRLEGRDNGRRTQLILVSSPSLGDGKTTTSANLALTMAQEFRHKVVLVEADLRRPRLADLFGVRTEPGLMDVLVGAATLDEALVAVPGCQLLLLAAGHPGSRPTGLLASPMMQRSLDALRGRFDRIVVDTAPMAVADTHVLARLADAVLMVVRAGVTARPALDRAIAGLDRQKVLGVVLNGVDETTSAYSAPSPASQSAGE